MPTSDSGPPSPTDALSLPKASPLVSLIIVNLNGELFLDDCLNSLPRQTFRNFEVIIVDNGSRDQSVTKANQILPDIRWVLSNVNLGFAGGNNAGMRIANGKYVVLLNNDTELDERFLETLVEAAESDPKVGMVAPKILNFYERKRIDSIGGLLVCPDCLAQGRGRGETDQGQFDSVDTALLPSGCAALYRREMLDEIGLFDEDFFMYCEDTDLGLRGLWAGWQTISAPRAIVYHKYSGFSAPYSPFKMFLVERNHYLSALKNFTAGQLAWLPFWTIYRFLLMAYAVVAKKGKGQAGGLRALLWAFLRAHGSALRWAPKMLCRRPHPRRLNSRQFTDLLRLHRLSLANLLFKE